MIETNEDGLVLLKPLLQGWKDTKEEAQYSVEAGYNKTIEILSRSRRRKVFRNHRRQTFDGYCKKGHSLAVYGFVYRKDGKEYVGCRKCRENAQKNKQTSRI